MPTARMRHATEVTCYAPEWAVVNYVEKEVQQEELHNDPE